MIIDGTFIKNRLNCCKFGPRGLKIKILNGIELEKDKMDISRMYSRMKTSRMYLKTSTRVDLKTSRIDLKTPRMDFKTSRMHLQMMYVKLI